jgi:hypothetical protein
MKNYILIFLLVIATNCTKSPDMLEKALELSAHNRAELKKVLQHYENEPLKLKAAQFLISNMAGHVSYRNQAYIERYYNEIDSVNQYVNGEDGHAAYKAVIDKYIKSSSVTQDLGIVSAAYLIDNIDRAFDDWQNGLWANKITCYNTYTSCWYLIGCKHSWRCASQCYDVKNTSVSDEGYCS